MDIIAALPAHYSIQYDGIVRLKTPLGADGVERDVVWAELRDQYLRFFDAVDGAKMEGVDAFSFVLLSMYSLASTPQRDGESDFTVLVESCIGVSAAVEDITMTVDSLESADEWTDAINRVVLVDLFNYTDSLYALSDIVNEFDVKIEFQLLLSFRPVGGSTHVTVPSLQPDGQLLINAIEDLDDEHQPTVCVQSALRHTLVPFFTVLMVNVDFLFNLHAEGDSAVCGPFVQWLCVNATLQRQHAGTGSDDAGTGVAFAAGENVFDYRAPCPRFESGFNRILTLVFQQMEEATPDIIASIQKNESRSQPFDILDWHESLFLGALVGINCFAVQWDAHADTVLNHILDEEVPTDVEDDGSIKGSVASVGDQWFDRHSAAERPTLTTDFDVRSTNDVSVLKEQVTRLQAYVSDLKAGMVAERRQHAEESMAEVVKAAELASLLAVEKQRNESWQALYEDKCSECDRLQSEKATLKSALKAVMATKQ